MQHQTRFSLYRRTPGTAIAKISVSESQLLGRESAINTVEDCLQQQEENALLERRRMVEWLGT